MQQKYYGDYDRMIAMENYNQGIAGFPASFSMKDYLIYGDAAPMISCHTDHQPGINPNALGPLDRLAENMHKLGRDFHDSASEAVNNGNYIDINVSVGKGIGFTGGVIIDSDQNVRWYAGGGIMPTPTVGFSVTWSANQVTEGFNIGVQGNAFYGMAGQIGYSNGSLNIMKNYSNKNWFFEAGGGVSTLGFSLTGYYISSPIHNFNNKRK